MSSSLLFGLLAIANAALTQDPGEAELARSGMGWTMTRLDLEVVVSNDPAWMSVEGHARLRLDLERSAGPTLGVNDGMAAMHWVSLDAPAGAQVELDAGLAQAPAARLAHVRFAEELERGHELELDFALEWRARASQLDVRTGIALASWTALWYPMALPRIDLGQGMTARSISIPGTTTLHLPPEWIALADGELVERERTLEETREVWSVVERPVARSFAAGPYTAAERTIDGRVLRVYLLQEHPIGVDRLAELLAGSLAAQSAVLGPFPFVGYGVAEVPENFDPGWFAASQQTFLMAQSSAFAWPHGNLPLWAHEMGHAWWGNTVSTAGPGAKLVGEALAQLGVLIALEAQEGAEGAREFRAFSRSGYSPRQCARGYFELLAGGVDHALATLGDSGLDGGTTHELADSKGMWVWHMLRRKLGDELFFGVLRGLIERFAGRAMTLDDARAAFLAAAPEQDPATFFAQWLDRTGAPVIEASLHPQANGETEIRLVQAEAGEPFVLDLDLELTFEDGMKERERVPIRARETTWKCAHRGPIAALELDPDQELLLWRAEYGPRPGGGH